MLFIRTFSPWILLSLLALLSLCSSARERSQGGSRAQRSNKPSRGKFSQKNGMQCTWTTKDVSDTVRLLIKCENPQARITGGVNDRECEYLAKPQSCPGYQSNPQAYYKQVSRALKKLQGKLCTDESARVKAGMCKRALRDAHFKLDIRTSVTSAQSGEDPTTVSTTITTTTTTTTTTSTPAKPAPSGTPGDCKGRADHRKVAQEYCDSSWASVCAFFFSMLQSDDC